MTELPEWLLAAAAIACLLVTVFWIAMRLARRTKKPVASHTAQEIAQAAALPIVEPKPAKAPRAQRPKKIVVGESPDRPLLVIEAAATPHTYGRELDTRSGPIARLAALLQAVPGALLAVGTAGGKRLMEITIKGDLVRASDGKGLRAIAVGRDGAKEHARLFDVETIQQAINATALWQTASVIVAQKHLADINEKLEQIAQAVDSVSDWLANWRNARLASIYEYFQQVAQAIHAGELSASVRQQLEACERDLVELFDHLARDFEQELQAQVEHKERFGTGRLTADLGRKIEKLEKIGRDMQACLTVRVGGWHLFGMYPGEPELVRARRDSIERSSLRLAGMADGLQSALGAEITAMRSRINRKSTLKKRRATLTQRRDEAVQTLSDATQSIDGAMRRTEKSFHANDQPTRILVEVQDGAIVGARAALA
jgi:ketosteroid isomerase-like protein